MYVSCYTVQILTHRCTIGQELEVLGAEYGRQKTDVCVSRLFYKHMASFTRHGAIAVDGARENMFHWSLWDDLHVNSADAGAVHSIGAIDSTIYQWVQYPLPHGTIGRRTAITVSCKQTLRFA